MNTSPAGIELIKDYEGLVLEAYPDPGTGGDPWTIGYGHTGPEVKPGFVINIEQAGAYLKEDLAKFEEAVSMLITVELNQYEFDALVSFTYNCGWFALEDSTLRRRLNAGEAKCPVFKEELPKWVNGGNGPMPGLVRRRDAEAELACASVSSGLKSFLEDAALYYAEEKHQIAAWRELEASLGLGVLKKFKAAYRNAPAVVEEVTESPPVRGQFPLQVPYFYQRDSKTGHGERSCFSSAMAMALAYINPDAIKGDDDWYLNEVFRFGDSVSSEAQVAAAHSLGFAAEFRMDGSEKLLLEILDSDTPVPIGILHHGTVDQPSGGGHWVCLIGYDDKYFHVHDPFGELNLVGGGYPKAGPTDGKFQKYSRKNLMERWLINGSGKDGWLCDLR
jgi:GH24 family phage-related lysozyme (muramidase)